jgi:hypothetical protein
MTYWSLSNDVSEGQKLETVRLFLHENRKTFMEFKNIEWFNNLTTMLKTYKAPKIVAPTT